MRELQAPVEHGGEGSHLEVIRSCRPLGARQCPPDFVPPSEATQQEAFGVKGA